MQKRIWAAALAGILALSSIFSGCGGNEEKITEEADSAMGRYLEEEFVLPKEDIYIASDITMLEDGTLRMATMDEDGKVKIWDYQDNQWEDNTQVLGEYPQVEGDGTWVDRVALAPTGEIAISRYESEGQGTNGFYVIDQEGKLRDLGAVIKSSEDFPILLDMQFTDDGNIVMQGYYDFLSLYDSETGELLQDLSEDGVVTFSMVRDKMALIAQHKFQFVDWKTGTSLDTDQVLEDQIESDKRNLEFYTSSSVPVSFAPGKEEDNMFYCWKEGIFSYSFGGNVVEKVVDGKLCSLSSSDFGMRRLVVGQDNDFFVLGGDGLDFKLLHYTYSSDTPTTPGVTLSLYSLIEDDNITKWIPQFQKKYPDIYVDYQVGMSQEDGVSVSDALKNLNTEVMAGKGPDVFLLDNLPIDSYVEKGMLEDISHILDEVDSTDGLLENVKNCFEKDGKIYYMPARIGIPVMAGKKENLEGIIDLSSMAEKAAKMKEEAPDAYVFNPYRWIVYLVELWTDTCSPAWTTEDGAINEEALKEFYTRIKEMYDLDENPYADQYSEEDMIDTDIMNHYYTGIGSDAMMLSGDIGKIAYGSVSGVSEYSELCSVLQEKDMVMKPWNGQVENCFVPNLMLGISSKCKEKEAAETFLSYCYSKDVQKLDSYAGFAVNRAVLDDMDYWKEGAQEESSSGSSIMTPDGEVIQLMVTNIALEEEHIQPLREIIDQVKNPVPYNYLVTNAVEKEALSIASGQESIDEAVANVSQKLNLYLTE